jgi:hypothetical protein
MDFRRQLEKQIGFLDRSCKAYDQGYIDESIRIAAVIRVLIHDTANSTSLLRHLNATNIELVSTAPLRPDAQGVYSAFAMGSYTLSNTEVSKWLPFLERGQFKISLPISLWWTQTVYSNFRYKLSRRHIVLAAPNKDGGAHVDRDITPAYAALAESGSLGIFGYGKRDDPARVEVPIENGHLGYLRAFGYELLSSRELLNLI